MSRKEFLRRLSKALKGLIQSEREHYINYYDEIISDMMDSGISENEAVEKQGDVDKIAEDILKNIDKEQLVKHDIIGIVLAVLTIIVTVISVICMLVLPDAGAISLMDSDGPTSVFVAGKIMEPVVLYIINAALIVIDIVYFAVRRKTTGIITFIVILVITGAIYLLRDTITGNDKSDSGIADEELINDENWVESRTELVIELFNDEDYDTLCSEYVNDEMKNYLSKDFIDEAKAYVSEDWGDFISNGNIYSGEITQNGQRYTIVQVNSMYENVSVSFTIYFDEYKMLAGLYMK